MDLTRTSQKLAPVSNWKHTNLLLISMDFTPLCIQRIDINTNLCQSILEIDFQYQRHWQDSLTLPLNDSFSQNDHDFGRRYKSLCVYTLKLACGISFVRFYGLPKFDCLDIALLRITCSDVSSLDFCLACAVNCSWSRAISIDFCHVILDPMFISFSRILWFTPISIRSRTISSLLSKLQSRTSNFNSVTNWLNVSISDWTLVWNLYLFYTT